MAIVVELLLVVFVCVTIYYAFYRIKNRKMYSFMASMPGTPVELPILGDSLTYFGKDSEALWITMSNIIAEMQKSGPFRMWLGPVPTINMNKPKYVEDFLSNSEAQCRSVLARNAGKAWFGNSILLQNPPQWRHNRKMIQQTFSQKSLDSFLPVFSKQAEILTECLRSHANTGELFDVGSYIDRLAFDIISGTAMGAETSTQKGEDASLLKCVEFGLDEVSHRSSKPWMNPDSLFKFSSMYKDHLKYCGQFHKYIENILQTKQQQKRDAEESFSNGIDQKANKLNHKIFLDHLLQLNESNHYSDQELHSETATFLMAGYETTGVTMKMALFFLANHLDVQEKAYQEIIQVLGDKKDITNSDLSKLKYLEMVVKETLRRHSVVPIVPRISTSDIPLHDGRILPKDVDVFILVEALHKDPISWPDPEKFDPDRFLSVNEEKRHPFSFMAFGGGIRMCLGYKYAMMEIMTILAFVLREYELFTPLKYTDLVLAMELTLKVKNGYTIGLKSRRK